MADRDLYPRETDIKDSDIEAFQSAILKAYPNKQFLYSRMANKWGIRVEDDVTSLSEPGRIIISRIVDFARAEGRLLDLLGLAWTDKPNNPALNALAVEWFENRPGVIAKYSDELRQSLPADSLSLDGLEKLVEAKSRLVRLDRFISGLERISRALCRVNVANSKGTGFLIGQSTVLTNFHVVESAIKQGVKGDQVLCEFDFHDPEAETIGIRGRSDNLWLGPSSPYSASDLKGLGDPAADELDFAVIHLQDDVEADRCPLDFPKSPPIVSQNDFIIIGQHPGGREAQLAIGRVVEIPQNGLRYRYDVTTEAGSSGSPVLDLDLNLVGLHHAADPSTNPTYNQGIPITRIVGKIQSLDPEFATRASEGC